MRLPQVAVNRPVTTVMFFMAILLFGFVSLTMLPQDVLPDIELPSLTVITVYPGASAEDVEQQVTKVLEDVLSGASDLKNIASQSKENVSFISLEFNWGSDLDEAANDVRDLLELKKGDLPEDAESPAIYKITSSMMPILIYNIEANESFNGLNKIIDDKISNRLKKVEGVGTIITIGQPVREIKVELDPFKLKAYRLSPGRISKIIEMENLTIPGGSIKVGASDLAVRVPGEFETVDEMENVVLTSFEGKIIHLKDVATIRDDFKEKDEFVSSFGQKAVMLMVQKQSGSNSLQVAKSVKAEIKNIQKILPADVRIKEMLDSSELVSHSIKNLSKTIMYGAVFVIIIVFVFLRNIRSSLIIILSIPFSLITAFIFMFIANFTINIFSLMALVIAIGMVVDSSIVVLENITQHIEKGEKPREAAIFGSSEMGMAISASTLTTIAVFLPMVFLGGMVGILFKQLALLTSITLIASLFTALTLTPMMASRLIKPMKDENKTHGPLFRLSEKLFVGTEKGYAKVLSWAVYHRVITILTVSALLGFTIWTSRDFGTDYIPEMDAGDLNAVIETEVGTSAKETARVAEKVEKIFEEEASGEIRSMYAIAGQTEDGVLTSIGFSEGKNLASLGAKLTLPEDRNYTAKQAAERIRNRIEKELPEITKLRVTGVALLEMALIGNKKPIEIKVMGNDFDRINATAELIQGKLKDMPGLVNVTNTIDEGKLEVQLRVNREKAQSMGLNTAMIASTVRQSIYGAEAGEFKEKGEEYDIMVRYAPEHRNRITDLNNITLTTLKGEQVPLYTVAEIKEGRGPLEIKRVSQQRVVYVESDLREDTSLGDAVKRVQKKIAGLDIPAGVMIAFGGQLEEQKESFSSLYLLFVLGFILVYMVMASQFESFRHPFIIIFTVPLALMGVIWAFKITGVTLSVVTFIGVIMLLGVVVNNGIILVDYTNLLHARGRNLMQAVVEAGHSRLRPVLMTAFTTILGMLPMATSTGMGSEMWSPLGITVIGGLLVATFITLIVIPVVYVTMHRRELPKLKT